MRIIALGLGEAWRNRRVNLALGLILSVGIVAQLYAVMTANVSADTLDRYNRARFGETETWTVSGEHAITLPTMYALSEFLAARRVEFGQQRLAATGTFDVELRTPDRAEPVAQSLRLVGPDWNEITDDDLPARLFDDGSTDGIPVLWERSSPSSPTGCTEPESDGAGDTAAPPLRLCPLGIRSEPNEGLRALGDVPLDRRWIPYTSTISPTITFVCRPAARTRCTEIARLALRTVGSKPGQPVRIDRGDRLQPLIAQRAAENRRGADILAVVAGAGVALASSIAAQSRSRRYTLYRCLGGSRLGISGISGCEGLTIVTCSVIVCSIALLIATGASPETFSSIQGVEPQAVAPPISDVLTLLARLVGLGLFTAVPAATVAGIAPLSIE